jgi:hypothetical protein
MIKMVDCTGFIQPLNLECWLVNTFAGSAEIFTFIALIAIAGLGAYFRMLNSTLLIMFALFAIIVANTILSTGIYFIIILIVGLVVSWSIGKIARQG